MGRINTNVPSLIAQSNLNQVNNDLETRLERLATGIRLNRGKDDPAGLIISERIRSDLEGISQGIDNAQRASSVIATTEAALAEVGDLLNSIRALIVESANTGGNSAEERSAGGLNLLDGSLDYTLSGVSASAVSKAQVFGANFVGNGPVQVDVSVLASAQTGALYLSGFNADTGGQVTSTTTLRIAGSLGVGVIEVVSGTSLNDLVAAVNNLRSVARPMRPRAWCSTRPSTGRTTLYPSSGSAGPRTRPRTPCRSTRRPTTTSSRQPARSGRRRARTSARRPATRAGT
jgi:flagellin